MTASAAGRARTWRVMTQKVVVSYHESVEYTESGERREALGVTDIDDMTVHLALDQSQDKLAETELHELLHLCWNLAGLGADHDHAGQENVVKRLSPVLLSALRDNPRLVKQLVGRA